MIVVDIETTGLDPERCQIVSIGAVDFSNPSRTFYRECRVARGAKITKEALTITGFTLKELHRRDKPELKSILASFLRWAKASDDRTLAGENPWFDASFLRRAVSAYGFEWPFGHRMVDLHSVCYSRMLQLGVTIPRVEKASGIGLDFTVRLVGLGIVRGLHNALQDAKLEAEALSRLIAGRHLLEEFASYPTPSLLRATRTRGRSSVRANE